MTKKKSNATTGRPKQYDEEMLRAVIAGMLGAGVSAEDIDEKSVKPLLCEKHGVSDAINTGSLARHVETVLRAVLEEEKKALVSALPSEIAPAVDDVVVRMTQDLLLLVARQNAFCRQEAERECEILRQDKANANWRISELEGEIAHLTEQLSDREVAMAARDTELSAAQQQIESLKSELIQRGPEVRTVDFLFDELRDPAVRDDLRNFLSDIAREPHAQAESS